MFCSLPLVSSQEEVNGCRFHLSNKQKKTTENYISTVNPSSVAMTLHQSKQFPLIETLPSIARVPPDDLNSFYLFSLDSLQSLYILMQKKAKETSNKAEQSKGKHKN